MEVSKGEVKHQLSNRLSNRFLRLWLKQSQRGFTLLELMVVMIFVTILALIGMPNYINQVGKSREIEAKMKLGSIARAQQAYHFEKGTFADTLAKLDLSNAVLASKYYNFTDASVVDSSKVKHEALPIDYDTDQVKNYASGIYFNAGAYAIVFCQAFELGETVQAPDAYTDDCINGNKIY